MSTKQIKHHVSHQPANQANQHTHPTHSPTSTRIKPFAYYLKEAKETTTKSTNSQ